jgi:hypothetical protein
MKAVAIAARDEMWFSVSTGGFFMNGARGGLVTDIEGIIVHGSIFSSVMATVFTGAQKVCKR